MGMGVFKSSSCDSLGQSDLGTTSRESRLVKYFYLPLQGTLVDVWSFHNLAKRRNEGGGGRVISVIKDESFHWQRLWGAFPVDSEGLSLLQQSPGACGSAPQSADSRVLLGRWHLSFSAARYPSPYFKLNSWSASKASLFSLQKCSQLCYYPLNTTIHAWRFVSKEI